jgi:hypothetical protein
MIIPTCRGMSQSQDGANQLITREPNENPRTRRHKIFFIEIHLLAGKLVLVVVIRTN